MPYMTSPLAQKIGPIGIPEPWRPMDVVEILTPGGNNIFDDTRCVRGYECGVRDRRIESPRIENPRIHKPRISDRGAITSIGVEWKAIATNSVIVTDLRTRTKSLGLYRQIRLAPRRKGLLRTKPSASGVLNAVIKGAIAIPDNKSTSRFPNCFFSLGHSLRTSSMSRRGNCWDNAVAESFFSTLRMKM